MGFCKHLQQPVGRSALVGCIGPVSAGLGDGGAGAAPLHQQSIPTRRDPRIPLQTRMGALIRTGNSPSGKSENLELLKDTRGKVGDSACSFISS